MKKHHLIIAALVMMVAGCGWFFWKHFTHQDPQPTATEQLRDSILYHSGKAHQHNDSANYHRKKYEEAWNTYVDSANASLDRDSMRAALRARIRDTIRAELGRQPGALRTAETGNL